MTYKVAKLTRGLGVTVTGPNGEFEATVLRTVDGIGYAVMTPFGRRLLVEAHQVSINR